MKKYFPLILLFGLGLTHGAVLVEAIDAEGIRSQIFIEGKRIRAQTDDSPEYILIDTSTRKMLAVSVEERIVVDLSASFAEQLRLNAGGEQTDVQLKSLGEGPKIAGFRTQRYQVQAGGQYCGEEFLSKEAANSLGDEIVSTLNSMPNEEGAESDPCERFFINRPQEFANYGLPLKSIFATGELDYEVTRIERDTTVPSGGFEPPVGYDLVSMDQMMQQEFSLSEEDMEAMPSAEELESMMPTEEDLEKMKRALKQMMEKDFGNKNK